MFRSCAFEVYKKKKLLVNHRTNFKKFLDTFSQINIRQGVRYLTSNLKRAKKDYDDVKMQLDRLTEIIKSNEYDKIRSYAIKLESKIPYVGSGVFAVYRDIYNCEIQNTYDYDISLDYTHVNIFYDKSGVSWIILSWLEGSDCVNQKLVEQIDLATDENKINIINNLMLNYTENIFINIDYINKLDKNGKEKLESKFNGTCDGDFIILNEVVMPMKCEIEQVFQMGVLQ